MAERVRNCWCGNPRLEPFHGEYFRCATCETLVLAESRGPEGGPVRDDDADFYGKQYYQKYVTATRGFPAIEERARLDLPERCLHWLRAILKYKVPPGKSLELGSAHGGFVAMMGWCGFDATGIEMSPWLVEWSKQTFGVNILTGPVEKQSLPVGSYDVIALFDVLEHFPDPVSAMRHCVSLLKSDGILVVQTPSYPPGTSFDGLEKAGHEFVKQLKPEEHLYLFSDRSVMQFFTQLGVPNVQFEPAIFSHYDMFLVASRGPLEPLDVEARDRTLSSSPHGRLIQACLDQAARLRELENRLKNVEGDCSHWRDRFYELRDGSRSG